MFSSRCLGFIAFVSLPLFATPVDVSIKGKVTDGTTGLPGALVYLNSAPSLRDTSGADGIFELKGQIETVAVAPFNVAVGHVPKSRVARNALHFTIAASTAGGSVEVFTVNGRRVHAVLLGGLEAGNHRVSLPPLATGFHVVHLTVDGLTTVGNLITAGGAVFYRETASARPCAPGARNGAAAPAMDSLVVEKSGYLTMKIGVDGYTLENLGVTMTKDGPVTCPDFKVPAVSELVANPKLPDPFKFIDGTRISKKSDWPCLRKQLIGLLGYSHGDLPEDIGEVSATYANGKLTVTIKTASQSGSFDVTITKLPSGDGPFPAIITLGGATIATPAGIAEIGLPQSTIANEGSRSGLYSKLYGNSRAGSMLMWAWGVSRIIDGLEMTTGHKIDPRRLGVTGCSRNGKGAMVCGVYDERIALTLPMEGGSGGISSWRIAKVENNNKGEHPDGCQTASQIVGESGWLAPQFNQFATGSAGLDKLPVDAHTLAAICAPRAIFFVEGSKNSWNCNVCCWTAASAARMVYDALGVKSNIGIIMTDHNHCSGYGDQEKTAYNAFCKRFLLDDTTMTTDYFKNDGKFDKLIDFSKWIDWTAPTLEGDLAAPTGK